MTWTASVLVGKGTFARHELQYDSTNLRPLPTTMCAHFKLYLRALNPLLTWSRFVGPESGESCKYRVYKDTGMIAERPKACV
jgi:hypothetical protein